MRRTKVDGMNMPEGDNGVDSVATPLGRYKKSVSSAVGSRWNYYIQQRMSLLQTGKITVIFSLDSRGKVRSFRIEENTSNPAHAALIEQCVREAEFDPPPTESLRNGAFEYPMSFHLL
jgi:TonB family protein